MLSADNELAVPTSGPCSHSGKPTICMCAQKWASHAQQYVCTRVASLHTHLATLPNTQVSTVHGGTPAQSYKL